MLDIMELYVTNIVLQSHAIITEVVTLLVIAFATLDILETLAIAAKLITLTIPIVRLVCCNSKV